MCDMCVVVKTKSGLIIHEDGCPNASSRCRVCRKRFTSLKGRLHYCSEECYSIDNKPIPKKTETEG